MRETASGTQSSGRARPVGEVERRGAGGYRWPQGRLSEASESVLVGLLLLAAVVSVITGSGISLFITVLAAWILLPLVVGVRNVLDAGCVFMLITIGIVLVVGLAQHGPRSMLP